MVFVNSKQPKATMLGNRLGKYPSYPRLFPVRRLFDGQPSKYIVNAVGDDHVDQKTVYNWPSPR